MPLCSACGSPFHKKNSMDCPKHPMKVQAERLAALEQQKRRAKSAEKKRRAKQQEVKEDTEQLEKRVADVLRVKPAVETLRTSLYQPSARGAMQALLQEVLGDSVDQVGTMGTTALVMVCTQGNVDEARALVEIGGADLNLEALEFIESTSMKDEHIGKDVSAWKKQRTPLAAAAARGKVAVAEYLIERGADPNKATTNGGWTPLYLAVHEGHIEFAQVLLEKGADPNKATTNGGWTPLYLAVHEGHIEFAQVLLEKGADPNKATTDKGTTPLLVAVQHGHIYFAQMLLDRGADPKKARNDGWTPLLVAVQTGHIDIAQVLLEKGADPNNNGYTPLHVAVKGGHIEFAQVLLEKGADPNMATTKDGTTPLHLAVEGGHTEFAQVLLEKGADPNKAKTKDGATPLWLAVNGGRTEFAQVLLEKGADPNKATMKKGWTPLHLAASKGLLGMVVALLTKATSIDPDHAALNGDTPLFNAALSGHHNVVMTLLCHVKDPNLGRLHSGRYTPLSAAIINSHLEMACAMLEYSTVCLVRPGDDVPLAVVQKLQNTPKLRTAIANGKSAVFGSTLRAHQLWLWCNLVEAVGPNPNANTLRLNVQRGNVLQGLCAQFGIDETTGEVSTAATAQQLDVQFAGENGGGDGLRREWLNQATNEIVDMARGLFSSKDGGRTIQPNPESSIAAGPDHLSYFALLGRIAGFALYHRETIAANWTTSFIKAAFGFSITSRDLASVDPEMYTNYVELIETYVASEHDGMPIAEYWRDVLMMGDLTFAVDPPLEEYSDHGRPEKKRKIEKVELKPGGSQIEVTEANKAEYIKLFVEHRLVGSIKEQIQAFQRGLGVFFPVPFLARLRRECTAADIKLLLCGAPEVDVDEWEASAKYLGGFGAGSDQVRWFWSVIRGMSAEERAKVLDFSTGSAQAPATGFANLMGYSGQQQRFTLQLIGGSDARLPTAATCFNRLYMPAYTSEDQLKARLLTTISNAEGFDEGAVRM